jgi:hypothetical protein
MKNRSYHYVYGRAAGSTRVATAQHKVVSSVRYQFSLYHVIRLVDGNKAEEGLYAKLILQSVSMHDHVSDRRWLISH